MLGHEHRDTIINMGQLGWALECQNKWEEAEAMYRKALALQEQVIGAEHPHTLSCMRALMAVLSKQGKPEAETVSFKLLGLQDIVLDPTHDATMLTIWSLGLKLEQSANYSGAEQMYRVLLDS